MADADLTERIKTYKLGLKAAAKVKSLEKTKLRMKKYREAEKAKLGTKLYNHQLNVQVQKSVARKNKIATVEAEEKKEAADRAALLQKSDGEQSFISVANGNAKYHFYDNVIKLHGTKANIIGHIRFFEEK